MSHWMTSGKNRLKAKQKDTFAARAKQAAKAANALSADALMGIAPVIPSARNPRRRRSGRPPGVNPMMARGVMVQIQPPQAREATQSVAEMVFQDYDAQFRQQQQQQQHDTQQQLPQRRRRIRDPAISLQLRFRSQQQQQPPKFMRQAVPYPQGPFGQFVVDDSLGPLHPPTQAVQGGIPFIQKLGQEKQRRQQQQLEQYYEEESRGLVSHVYPNPSVDLTEIKTFASGAIATGNGIARFQRQPLLPYHADPTTLSVNHPTTPFNTTPSRNVAPHANYHSSFDADKPESAGFGANAYPIEHEGLYDNQQSWPLQDFTNHLPFQKYSESHNLNSAYMAKPLQTFGFGSPSFDQASPERFGDFGHDEQYVQHYQRRHQPHAMYPPMKIRHQSDRGNEAFGFDNTMNDDAFHFNDNNVGERGQMLPSNSKSNPFESFAYREEDHQSTDAFGRPLESNAAAFPLLPPPFAGGKRPFDDSNSATGIKTSRQRLGGDDYFSPIHQDEADVSPANNQGIALFQQRPLQRQNRSEVEEVDEAPIRGIALFQSRSETSSPLPAPSETMESELAKENRPSHSLSRSLDGDRGRHETRCETEGKRGQLGKHRPETLDSKKVTEAPADSGKMQQPTILKEHPQTQSSAPTSDSIDSSSSDSTGSSSSSSSESQDGGSEAGPGASNSHHHLQTQPTRRKLPSNETADPSTQSSALASHCDSENKDNQRNSVPPMLRFFDCDVEVNSVGVPLSTPNSPVAPPKPSARPGPAQPRKRSPGSHSISSQESLTDLLQESAGKSLWEF